MLYIIVQHHDTDHTHIHIVINLIDNNGKRISDQNEKLLNTSACMELTKKYGLYIASDKKNVKDHRLSLSHLLNELSDLKNTLLAATGGNLRKMLQWIKAGALEILPG